MSDYISIKEAAEKLGVSSQTLRRWDKQGKLSSIRHPMNNYRVYSIQQLENVVSELKSFYHMDFSDKTSLSDIDPFYQSSYGTLYNMDCISFLKSIPDSSVDLVIADPPYNIKKAEWDTFESQKDYINWSMKWINEAARILTPHGSIYICGFSEILADIKWSVSHLFKGCKWLVWYYRNKANMGNDWGRSHESILHFRKSKEFIFNIDEVRIPYNQHTLKYPKRPQAITSQYGNGKSYEWEPNPNGAKPKDVFEIPTISNHSWERVTHPTQKPIELIKKLILASSNHNSVIVDPFGGSGTTYLVAEAFYREWYGCDISEEYCSNTSNRLQNTNLLYRIREGIDEKESINRRVKLRG